MNGMMIYEGLTHIDDSFILGSMPSAAAQAPRPRGLSRFLNSGLGAAVISGAVALGVLIFVVLAGRVPPETPPVTPSDSTDLPPAMETDTDSEAVTEPEAETEEITQEETEAITEDTVIDTPEEAEARKDELIAILDGLDYKWNILNDPSYYFDQYTPVKAFGVYGVPYMLDYIMEHEGETDAEELKRLGVILHFAYHNLGITDTSEWYRKENNDSQDVFENLQALVQHLQKNGLPSPEELIKTETPPQKDTPSDNPVHTMSPDELKTAVYELLEDLYVNKIDLLYSDLFSAFYLCPASTFYPEAFSHVSIYGIESVPYILEYILDHDGIYHDKDFIQNNGYGKLTHLRFLLSAVYEMLGVKGFIEYHWIDPTQNFSYYTTPMAQYLLDHLHEYGLHPIYPFYSPEEAAVLQKNIYNEIQVFHFNWDLTDNLDRYHASASHVTDFGPYAVPYILDYILSHEDQPLTPDEELNLGVLLHLSYRMLGVETTAAWHMPAEPVESTTDPFPYARELAAHLSEYGLEAVS